MVLLPQGIDGGHAFLGRSAQPIGQVVLCRGVVPKIPLGDDLLDHALMIPLDVCE